MKINFFNEYKKVHKVALWEFALKLFTSIMIRGTLLIIPLLFSEAIDYLTDGLYDQAIIFLIVLLFVTLVYRLFEGFNQMAYYKLYRKLFKYYNELALKKTRDNSLFSLSRFSSSAYSNIVITDIDIICTFFTSLVVRIVQIIEFIVIFSYFLSLNIYIFISAVVISLIMLVISIKSGNKIQELNEKRKTSLDGMSASVFEFFTGIREIKSYNLFNEITKSTDEKVDNYLKDHSKYNVKFNFNNHVILYVFEAVRIITVLYGLLLVKEGQFAVGTLILIYNYYQKIIDNFTTILTINVETRNVNVSFNRFNKLVEYSHDEKKGLEIDKNNIKTDIKFDNVLYGFRDNPTLKDASMYAPENAITVLTGRDEAALDGIYDLLLKLNRQHEGTITLGDIPIGEIDDEYYYDIVSCVRRGMMFFNMSIKDNLTLIESDFDKVLELSKKIGLDEKIMKLPDGYDTIITDTTPVSQATKKLLLVARMLLTESKVLLIDDIMGGLNEEQEKKVFKFLDEMKKDHTIIIISSSKQLLDNADKVYDVSDKTIRSI